MNKKIIIQLFILFIIFILIAFLFYQYSLKKNFQSQKTKKDIIYSNSGESSSNVINNIEYNSYDAIGNRYQIKAEFGTISDENPNLIIMKNVDAAIIFNNYEKILINALTATYNIVNYDTIFKDKINIEYGEHFLKCDDVNLFFKDHKINLYNNINYTNLNTSLLADEIEIDLLTKNLKIYMIDKEKKIEATYKTNGTN